MTNNFYNLPPSWNPGYVIPDYVMAEPPGRGAFVTSWLPRGTISALVPEFQAVKTAREILGRNDAGLGSLGDDTLGARPASMNKDPIASYGQRAASWLMHSIRSVPAEKRSATLRAVFDAIDPSLWGKVEIEANTLRARGMAAKPALQQAIATSMSAGMLHELVVTGRKAMRGDRSPVAREGQLGLGVYPDQVPKATVYALQSLGFSIGDLNPVKYLTKAGSTVASGIRWLSGAAGVSAAAGATASFVEKSIKTLGSLACQVASSGAGQAAATAAAGPVGGAGAAAASTACGQPQAGDAYVAPPPPPPPSSRSWVAPVAVGVVALGAVALIWKRK